MNTPSKAPRSINELVRTATNKLDAITEKVKKDLFQIVSNELNHTDEKGKKLMEGEMMLYISELFMRIISKEYSKKEKAEPLKLYKLYAHLAKELNFTQALDQLERNQKDIDKAEKKQKKKLKKELRKKREKEQKKSEINMGNQQISGKSNATAGNNNDGSNYGNLQGDGIFITGHGNVVIIDGKRIWDRKTPIEKPEKEDTFEPENENTQEWNKEDEKNKENNQKPEQDKTNEPSQPTQPGKKQDEKPVGKEEPQEKEEPKLTPVGEVIVYPDPEKKPEPKPTPESEERNIPTPIVPPQIEPEPEEADEQEEEIEEEITTEEGNQDYFNLDASLSDVESIHEETAKHQTEEELRAKYSKLWKFDLLGKAKFFLMRGLMREKKINQQMKRAKNEPFTDDQALNTELGKGVNRQELETAFNGGNIEKQIKDIPELNQACISFIKGELSETSFQAFFNALVKNKKKKFWIQKIDYLGTNILEKLKFEKGQLELINELAKKLEQGGNTAQVEEKIEDFLKTYQKNPDFLKTIRPDLASKNSEKLKTYLRHEQTKRVLALNNLKMNLNVFTDKKAAYQIDNSDREKWWVYKLGKKIDKLPRWAQTAGFTGSGLLLGLTGGALGLGIVGSSMLVTGWVAGMTGFKNYIKKWTHYTKEQNTHEKNMTRNLSNELAKIEKRKEDTQLKGAKNWYRSYRAGRQLDLYNNATQSFEKTKTISEKLLAFGTSLKTPTEEEKSLAKEILREAKARLEAYYKTGHNFLASENMAQIESDMNELHMAISMVCEKLNLEYKDIDSEELIKNQISGYHHASSVFKKQRAKLAKKYGFATGAISFASAWGLQAMMGTGMHSHEAVPWSTISKPNISGKEYFELGGTELWNINNWWGQIHDGVKNAFDGLGNNTTVNIHYGAGTDATQVLPGSKFLDASVYHDKLTEVVNEIDMLSLSNSQKAAFIKQLQDEPWKADWTKWFTSDYLHGQRCAEWLLETARGLANSGSNLVPEFSYDSAMNIAGSQAHNQTERFFNINMKIVENIAGKAGSGRSWWVPITGFANTFKKEPKNSDFSSPEETIAIEKPEINNETSEKKDIPVVFTAPAADNTLPDEVENQQKTIEEEIAEIRNTRAEKEKTMKKENQEEYERIYQKTGIDLRNINDKESRFVKLADLDMKEFDFENKIYLTHHTSKDSAENIVKTGLYHRGVLQWTTNLVGKDTLLEHLKNAENGNYRHRNSDTVIILEFDKKEFNINPGEKNVIDRIWEKLMLDNRLPQHQLSVPPQYIKKVVSLDLKPKDLISSITPTINITENEVTPTITPQVPETIVETFLVDEKRKQFTQAIREYRELIDKLDIWKEQQRSLNKTADRLFGNVFSVDSDRRSPQEKIKQFEDGITLLTQLKKEMQKEQNSKN